MKKSMSAMMKLTPPGGGMVRSGAAITESMKPLVLFSLNAALTTSDASKAATIQAQYGSGRDNPETTITVHNSRTSVSASTYLFEGDSGDYGLAFHDSGTDYIVVNMECP